MARRRFHDDDEERPNWFWRFLKGAFVSVFACASVLAVLSLYVLPPPVEHPEPGEQAGTGEPAIIGGIEVSDQPAYSTAGATGAGASGQPAPAAETFGPIELAGPAIEVNSAAYTEVPSEPLVAVVLDDVAADPLIHGPMLALEIPVTIGVVAGHPGDVETAKRAFDAGFEVLAELPVAQPGQGNGTELEFGLSREEAAARTEALMRRLPIAVAASRPAAESSELGEGLREGILSALVPHGFGYVDRGEGMIAAVDGTPGEVPGATPSSGQESGQMAPKPTPPVSDQGGGAQGSGDGSPPAGAAEGAPADAQAAAADGSTLAAAVLPGARIAASRFTIPAGADAGQIIAVLDQAGTEAATLGSAVVYATASEELFLALQLWGGSGEAGAVHLAPLSAVIRRQTGG